MKKRILIIILAFGCNFIFAQNITPESALQVAKNYYYEMSQFHYKYNYNEIELSLSATISKNEMPLLYIFNADNNKGFVIVSTNSNSYPILAYAFEGTYSHENQSPGFNSLIEHYKMEIQYLIKNKIKSNKYIDSLWNIYLSDTFLNTLNINKEIRGGSPLITSEWGQGCYFNEDCPVDSSGPCGHALVGCTAVAMAQIMNFHDFPSNGTGSNSYNNVNYGNISVDFSNSFYNWVNIPDQLFNYNNDLSLLLYNCGVSARMNYSANSSGASLSNAGLAFMNFFNYALDIQYIAKDMFTSGDWNNILRNELDNSRPILCEGWGSGGHSFNIDGYLGTDFFHVNWGWSGSYNGYFFLDNLNPGGNDYNSSQMALIGIQPNLLNGCIGIDTLTALVGAVNDCSGSNDYQNNSNCQWLISPDGAASITLSFIEFKTEEGFDLVNVYDGDNTSSLLIGSYSGQTIPNQIISTGNVLLIEFITNSNNTDAGWLATYSSSYCSAHEIRTAPQGAINDGSDSLSYMNNSDCQWLIQPNQASYVELSFIEFITEQNYDTLYIYDGSTTSAPLLAFYHGGTLPPTISSTGGSMLLHFVSDVGVTDVGWTAIYYSDGIQNTSDSFQTSFYKIFPNPTSTKFFVEITDSQITDYEIEVFDIYGKEVLEVEVGSQKTEMDLSQQPKGIYIIKVITDKQTITRKLIKQ